MCSSPDDSESKPRTAVVHVNCKYHWERSTNLSSPSSSPLPLPLMQLLGNPCSSAGPYRVMKEMEALKELEHD